MSHRRSAPIPNRAFFKRHPRAALLRDTGLAGAEAFLAVGQGDEKAVGPLLDANQRLRRLGIVAGMHTVQGDGWWARRQQYRLMTNPVRAAEWVCGQLVGVFDRTIALSPPDPSVLREHDILSSESGEPGNVALVDGSSVPPAVLEYQASMGVADIVIGMLDGRTDSQ